MKLPYENELYELRKWIDFTNANLHMQFLHTPQEIQRVYQWINAITRGIQADYPFYATTLPCVANILFQQNEVGAIFLNPAAFGELVVIVRHIKAEPVVVQFWSEIPCSKFIILVCDKTGFCVRSRYRFAHSIINVRNICIGIQPP